MALEWRNAFRTKAWLRLAYYRGGRIVVFDTETNGLGSSSKIIQFSAILYHVDSSLKLVEEEEMDVYVNPGEKLPEKITEITGITDEVLKDEKTEIELADEILAFLNRADSIAGYNVGFDIDQVQRMAERTGTRFRLKPSIDVLEMARDFVPKSEVKEHKLGNVVQHLLPDSSFVFHDSIEDVRATALVLETLIMKYDQIKREKEKQPAHLERAHLFINPRKKSMRRICLQLSVGQDGDIFYDIVGHYWSCKSTGTAKKLFKNIDLCDVEEQLYKKYVYPFSYKNIDQMAREWMKYRNEKDKERKNGGQKSE